MYASAVRAAARRVALPVTLALGGLSLWYGQSPPRTAGAYGSRAAESARLLSSQAGTAALWADAIRSGRVTGPAAAVALEEAEGDARTTAGRFSSWDPPPGTEPVRREVVALADEATRQLTDARIAAHEGRPSEVVARSATLKRLSGQLQQLAERVAP